MILWYAFIIGWLTVAYFTRGGFEAVLREGAVLLVLSLVLSLVIHLIKRMRRND